MEGTTEKAVGALRRALGCRGPADAAGSRPRAALGAVARSASLEAGEAEGYECGMKVNMAPPGSTERDEATMLPKVARSPRV